MNYMLVCAYVSNREFNWVVYLTIINRLYLLDWIGACDTEHKINWPDKLVSLKWFELIGFLFIHNYLTIFHA